MPKETKLGVAKKIKDELNGHALDSEGLAKASKETLDALLKAVLEMRVKMNKLEKELMDLKASITQ